ncbi:UDP-N-acetylglucosamine transferase subunit ALG13-like protein [Ooceraea biroi]|uniref:UDP-N-acetylglucosamine transferase subunit ALG13-like protein n=1 Tax=Ooceraea biroi TaxID=2015173 RepID=A0A026WXQ0_OOCBI|nr:UDP-N-acetylglucosamine transferase subunit ALG13-like protein [Ooceraea biroi]
MSMASCPSRSADKECIELSHVEISPRRKMSKRMQEPVDQWLGKEGYFRKPTPRDPTCLFRAISEQVYYTQYYHLRVRKECTTFMMRKRHLFEKFITVPFDHYLKEMQCFTEWGGPNEIRAMSLLYHRNIIIFVGEKQMCETVVRTDFKKGDILLCRTNTRQYESVYPISFVQTAAYCQSLVYEVVYKDIFKMPNITTVADKMLRNRSSTFRHDRFFQKGNLGIREQLTVDLYNKIKHESNDTDEVQCAWKGIPPIPYKVAKALAPDYYRNIELDIWCELKREVKSAGWSKYNSNELQVGGKCLIEISVNELEQFDRNHKNNRLKSLDYNISDSNNKIVQQQLKQGLFRLCGYIQEISTDKEPVLVFIEDLGEKKLVPYSALKPFPVTRRNKQKNWTPMNRNHAVNSDSSRRWKKTSTSFSRKKKDTTGLANVTANNTIKNVLINNANDDSINNNVDNNNIDAIRTVSNIDSDKKPKEEPYQTSENKMETGSKHATNDEANNNVPVAFDNLQTTVSNNVQQAADERKKADVIFRNKNTRSRETKNLDHGLQSSVSKQKPAGESTPYTPYDTNSQINTNSNANIFYITPDGFYPYAPGNFGDHNTNQMDPSFASRFFYNLHLLHLEQDSVRNLNPAYCGAMPYGQGQGVQTLVEPPNAHTNNIPSVEESIDCLVSGMQNCSLYDGSNSEVSKTSGASDPQNSKQFKQGSSKSNGRDLYQVMQKTKQPGNIKSNKPRGRPQNFRGSAYAQHSGQQSYSTMSSNPGGSYDAQRHDVCALPPQHHLDSSTTWTPHQATAMTPANSSGAYMPQYATAVYSAMPYHELLPPHCAGEGNMYYSGNFSWNPSYMPVPCLPPQHVDSAIESAAMPSYPQHAYPLTETYPPTNPSAGYPQTTSQSMVYPQPMMYPQPIQYALPPLPPPLPPPHVQEQWNSCMGQQSYMQYPVPPPQTIEPPSAAQNVMPHNSL